MKVKQLGVVMVCVASMMISSVAVAQVVKKQEEPATKGLHSTREIEMIKPNADGRDPVELEATSSAPVMFEARVKSWPVTQGFFVRWRVQVTCGGVAKQYFYPSSQQQGGSAIVALFGEGEPDEARLRRESLAGTRKAIVVDFNGRSFPMYCGANSTSPYKFMVVYEVKGLKDKAWTQRAWFVNRKGTIQ
jgi:hypothetical protein